MQLTIGGWVVFSVLLLVITYFNCIACFICTRDPEATAGITIIRSLFIWLVPLAGAIISLRLSYQLYESCWHYRLLMPFLQRWIYGEHWHPPNDNPDHNDLKTVTGRSSYEPEY